MSQLRLGFSLALAIALPLAGCDPDGGTTVGGADSADVAASGTSFSCVVVEVLDNPIEEGFGSIYDYDGDGFRQADGDSVEVSLRKDAELSEIKSKMILSIGQMSFGLQDKDDKVVQLEDEEGVIKWQGQLAREKPTSSNPEPAIPEIFTVRIIAALGVGWVHHEQAPEAQADCMARGMTSCCEGDSCEACEDVEALCTQRLDMGKIDCRKGVSVPDFDAL